MEVNESDIADKVAAGPLSLCPVALTESNILQLNTNKICFN